MDFHTGSGPRKEADRNPLRKHANSLNSSAGFWDSNCTVRSKSKSYLSLHWSVRALSWAEEPVITSTLRRLQRADRGQVLHEELARVRLSRSALPAHKYALRCSCFLLGHHALVRILRHCKDVGIPGQMLPRVAAGAHMHVLG